ncbi:molybdate ABC transporter substrate-binding protein [Allitabrizicola rongguiensis]|uniref:molybdate ABC transporter substrate-binding protein n=1 Tax=Alitabrizicola rongguiensis TaxID=2909234 RepID=UPI00387345E7
MIPLFSRRAALGLALALGTALPSVAAADEITVFAAASLKNALDAIATDWQAKTGNTTKISYAGSSALAKQIQEGAPADVFISAAVNWMDTLQKDKLIKPETRRDLLGNTLVLIAHGPDAPKIEVGKNLDLTGMLKGGKLSMALVDSVPAGQYGKEALTNLGLWSSVEGSVAQSDNVRAALQLVQLGEAPLGIVYASDAVADMEAGAEVTVVGAFPADTHKPIIYPAAIVSSSTSPAAEDFLKTLSSAAAAKVFEAQGFTVLK